MFLFIYLYNTLHVGHLTNWQFVLIRLLDGCKSGGKISGFGLYGIKSTGFSVFTIYYFIIQIVFNVFGGLDACGIGVFDIFS